MNQLEIGDKVEIYQAGEMVTIVTIELVTDKTASGRSKNGWQGNFIRHYENGYILPVNPMANSGRLHTGEPPQLHYSKEKTDRWYELVTELI